jgi:dTDP-4-dehydrorhamnose reductase
MKVLILGGSGMLGHKLRQLFASHFDTYVTLRRDFAAYKKYKLFNPTYSVDHVSADNFESVVRAIDAVQPAVVVNCIGIVKQAEAAKDPLASIEINALFPHRLARLCLANGIRLIHISTDCVFSGRKGNYAESDVSDAEDLYGRTKFLGEVSCEGCLTIRTSMIGRELETSYGLLDWFLSQEGRKINGYTKSIFSGFTTNALADILVTIIAEYQEMYGVWHVASQPISKFELLSLVKQVYQLNIHIEEDDSIEVDRSLNSERFQQTTDFITSSWYDMIEQMYKDPTPYSELRRPHAGR